MRKRIRLKDRLLPNYFRGEETMNMVTHIVGGALGILALVLGIIRSEGKPLSLVGAIVFGAMMIVLYTVSSVYHGLKPPQAKRSCRSLTTVPFTF